MLTFFTLPKPFIGHIGTIQLNAIRSWKSLDPGIDVILLGDEEGLEAAAERCSCRHVGGVRKNGFGTPLLNEAFRAAEAASAADILCFINTDIILLPEFIDALMACQRLGSPFLMIGRRCDVEIGDEIDVQSLEGRQHLRDLADRTGVLYSPAGADYFVYSRGVYRDVPPFAVGRGAFDNWLIFAGVHAGAAVVETTAVNLVLHQNHEVRSGAQHPMRGPERKENTRLTGRCGFGCHDSTHVLTPEGCVRRGRASFRRRVERGIAHHPHLRPALIPLHVAIRAVNRVRRLRWRRRPPVTASAGHPR